LALAILLATSGTAILASATRPQDAVVLLSSAGFREMGVGNGFAVGDGSLIITAHHIAFDHSEPGGHLMPGRITVFSPYLGDACHGVIIASDEELDLAAIEVPWKGHPALELATDKEIATAERLQTIRVAHVGQSLIADPNRRLTAEDLYQSDTQDVDTVAVRSEIPRFVELKVAGLLAEGWSGSPMILPGTTKVVACFTRLHRQAAGPERPQGPAVSQLRRVSMADRYLARLTEASKESPAASPPDALDVFRLALLAHLRNNPGMYEQAVGPAQQFITARPDNPIGYEAAAFALERAGRKDEAAGFYEKALQRRPVSFELQLYYSQFLAERGEPNKAMEILDKLKEAGTSRDLVSIAMVNVLGTQGRYDRCLQLLDEALAANPRNAYLWQQKAGCLVQSQGGRPSLQVAECLEKSVLLRPEIGPWRGNLARLLEQLGDLDRSEAHFRKLLEVEPDNPVVYVWLAEFIEKHRPAARQQAVELPEKALRLPPNPRGQSREDIEGLIGRLKADPNAPK
jgi:tetratricopeptide (TPR) repeat protein